MKRMTETEKWDDPWFRTLKPEYKVFWEFIRDRCDCAGVWKVDFAAVEFFTGLKLNPQEVLSAFGGRVVDITKGRWWVVKFVSFQCGAILSDKSIPHQKVKAKLVEHGLLGAYLGGSIPGSAPAVPAPQPPPSDRVVATLQEKKREEGEVEEEKKGGVGGNSEPPPVEYPKGFPPDEQSAVDWARAGGSRATDEQIRLYWNEAASRNGYDVTRQPITRWVQHCSARAIRTEGKTAEAKATQTSNGKLWALKTQLEAVQAEIMRLEGKQLRDEDGKPVIKPEDKEKYRELRKKAAELNDRIAKGQ